eukprot:6212231-Pleurochrysis_carterae.AAC.3
MPDVDEDPEADASSSFEAHKAVQTRLQNRPATSVCTWFHIFKLFNMLDLLEEASIRTADRRGALTMRLDAKPSNACVDGDVHHVALLGYISSSVSTNTEIRAIIHQPLLFCPQGPSGLKCEGLEYIRYICGCTTIRGSLVHRHKHLFTSVRRNNVPDIYDYVMKVQELGERSASAPQVRMRCDAKSANCACECQIANERRARRHL